MDMGIANLAFGLNDKPWTKRNANDPMPSVPEQKNVSAQASVDKRIEG